MFWKKTNEQLIKDKKRQITNLINKAKKIQSKMNGSVKDMQRKKDIQNIKLKVNRMKQEVYDMAKYVMKDGKLQKATEPNVMAEKPRIGRPPTRQAQIAVPQPQQPIPQEIPEPMPEEELFEEELAEEPQSQPQSQEFAQAQAQTQSVEVKVKVKMITGDAWTVNISEPEMLSFLHNMEFAIKEGTIMALGNIVLSGKQIVSFEIMEPN